MSLSRTMEVLNFLKFWKPNTSEAELSLHDGEDGEDSFFDLKITASPASCQNKNGSEPNSRARKQNNGVNVNSSRKILPIEYTFWPQTPIALLKSAPKFSLFASKNQKQTAVRDVHEPASVKSREEENSDRSSHGEISETKLNLMKLRNPKPSRKSIERSLNTEMIYSSSRASVSSLSSVRQVCRHLSKSKSTSACAKNSSEQRKDKAFLQYEDAIESAILHCKRSLNSSIIDSSNARRHGGRDDC